MTDSTTPSLPSLPCYPCPHRSACCAYGSTLSNDEAKAIAANHGDDKVYRTRWGEWRTRVTKGRCVFFVDNTCSIHRAGYYPAVCRGFPWTDAETGGPYQYDRSICPEFIHRPELAQILPYIPASQRRAQRSVGDSLAQVAAPKDQ